MKKKIKYFLTVFIILVCSTACSNLDRSLIFATHTTVGLELAVSPQESNPVNIIIGYKRSEGVINPVYDKEGIKTSVKNASGDPIPSSEKYRPKAYSVIAKLSGKINTKAKEAAAAEISGAQWFATGEAATKLADQPGIAGAVSGSPKIAEEAAKELKFGANLSKGSKVIVWRYLNVLYTSLDTLKDHDPVAAGHLNKLNKLSEKYLTKYDFVKYGLSRDGKILLIKAKRDTEILGKGQFGQILQYNGDLESSITALAYILKDTKNKMFQGDSDDTPVKINTGMENMFREEIDRQQKMKDSFQQKIGAESAVLNAANFLSNQLIN